MAATQIVQRRVDPDRKALMEHDPRRGQTLDAAHDDGLFQLEPGNAIGQQPARTVMAVVDMHLIAVAAQIFRRGQPRGARTDHPHRLPAGTARDQRLDPAVFPGGVGDEFLDRADRHRAVAREFDHAIALAQSVLWADAAADLGHGRGRVAQFVRLAQPAFRGQAQPVGDMIVERAMHRAIGHAALRAATRLLLCARHGVAIGDLLEIFCAQVGGALDRIGLRPVNEFQHRFGCHRTLLVLS